jgi:aminoacyl tRNA synthase complex-interacting multifunctional protein 1
MSDSHFVVVGAAAAVATATDTRVPEDISRLDLRVGKIVKVWNHPKADKLFCEEVRPSCVRQLTLPTVCQSWSLPCNWPLLACVLPAQIDVGEGAPRQIASGLRPYYSQEQMLNRRVIVVCNLKPKTMVRAA